MGRSGVVAAGAEHQQADEQREQHGEDADADDQGSTAGSCDRVSASTGDVVIRDVSDMDQPYRAGHREPDACQPSSELALERQQDGGDRRPASGPR